MESGKLRCPRYLDAELGLQNLGIREHVTAWVHAGWLVLGTSPISCELTHRPKSGELHDIMLTVLLSEGL